MQRVLRTIRRFVIIFVLAAIMSAVHGCAVANTAGRIVGAGVSTVGKAVGAGVNVAGKAARTVGPAAAL